VLAVLEYARKTSTKGGTADQRLFLAVHALVVAFSLTIAMLVAKVNLKFVESFGSAIAGSGFLVTMIYNHSSKEESEKRLMFKASLTIIYYLIYTGLLTTRYWTHLLLRLFWYSASTVYIVVFRFNKDGLGFTVGSYLLLMLVLCEIIFYVQARAQVKLYLASKKIKQQEKQLLDMLDSVPDQVLVCSAEHDKDLEPRPLYNNRWMRDFFGGSLVNEGLIIKPPKSKKKPSVRKLSKFQKRIFW